MARQKRIWRESQHPRDARGRFSRRGGEAWAKRAAGELMTSDATRAGDRPRISRNAKAGVVLQAHAQGGRPSAVRVPQATVTPRPSPAGMAMFNAQRLPTPVKRAAPQPVNLAGFNAPDAPAAPKKRTPRPAPGAAALIAARREEQAPHVPAMVAARTEPAKAPSAGAAGYAAMKRHTLVSLARSAGVRHQGRSNGEIGEALAVKDEEVKASRAAKLNPSGVGQSSAIEAKEAELAAARERFSGAYQGSAGFRSKQAGRSNDAQLRRAGEADRDVKRLEKELRQLRGELEPEAAKPLPPKPETVYDRYGDTTRAQFDALPLARQREIAADLRATSERHRGDQLNDGGAALLMGKFGVERKGRTVDTPRVGSDNGGMTPITKRQAAKLQAEQDAAEREQRYQVQKAERDAQEAIRRAEHEAEMEAKRAALRAKTPAGVRPGDGRPSIGTVTSRTTNPREKWNLGNTPGTGGSAPNMVISPVGHIDNRTANARIMNPLTPDGPYRYEIRDENTGEIIESGEDRDLDKVYAKANRIMSRTQGGGMARTAGKSTRFEARQTERPKDRSRGDFGKGPFYEHTVVEIDQDGNETVRVKTGSAAKAEAHAAEMNAKEQAANPKAPRTPTTNRKQIPRDTKIRARENERDGGRGVVNRHKALTRAEFDAMPENERTRVLQDLRQVARSKEEESYTIPSNRSSMGMTVRGMREAAHVKAAKEKLRELTYTAPPPVDNSIEGRATRLRAGDVRAIDNATIADLNEIARGAGLSGGSTGWPRQKLVDYIRNQVEAGDRLKTGREGNLADALRGATPSQVLAVLDALESDGMGETTVAKLKAAGKALGIKTGSDKRLIRRALADGAANAPAPVAKVDPPAAPKAEAPERSEAEIDAFIRSKGLYPDEFEGGEAEKRKWVKDYEAQFGPSKAPNEVSEDIKKLELRIRGIELARESASLYGDSSGLDEDEEGRAKVAARKELADLKAKLIDLQRAERGYDSTPSKAFAKVSDYDLERAIKGAVPGTKKRAALVAERDARAAARFKAARPKADAAQVAAPAAGTGPAKLLGGWRRDPNAYDPQAQTRDVEVDGKRYQVNSLGAGRMMNIRDREGHINTVGWENWQEVADAVRKAEAKRSTPTAPTRSRITPDAKRGALAASSSPVDTPRVKSQNGGMNLEPTAEEMRAMTPDQRRELAKAQKAAHLDKLRAATTEREVRDLLGNRQRHELEIVYRDLGGNPSPRTSEVTLRRSIIAKVLEGKTPATDAKPGETTLGVTESSRGRTTTVTLPDGSTAQRTSKTMAYTHAVVATHDLHADARDLRADMEVARQYADAYEAWIARGANLDELVAVPSGSGSINDDRAGLDNYSHYLPGFTPVEHRTRSGARWTSPAPGTFAIHGSQRHRSGGAHTYSDYEGFKDHEKNLREARENVEKGLAKAAELEAGPQHEYYVARWSQRIDTAHAAIGSPEVNAKNTGYEVIGVGGVATPDVKVTKPKPTLAEREAAKEEAKVAEKARRAKSDQDFVDRTRAAVERAIDEGDDPERALQSKTDQALRFMAKAVGAKIPRKPQTRYGTPAPLDAAEARKLIVEAIRKARGAEGKA